METATYLKNLKLSNQQLTAFDKIKEFVNSDKEVFILKGYAGTGKTTLLKSVVDFLKEDNNVVQLMAPTGRAAKILRDKTGYGTTIHSAIYKLKELENVNANSKEVADHEVKYHFPIDLSVTTQRILIVDEASMISSKKVTSELFNFGSDVLLDDILTHTFSSNKNNKIIFVGDPAQLPPVGDNNSFALDKSYFENLDINYDIFELTEVQRQKENGILANATKLRKVLNSKDTTELSFEYSKESFIKLNSVEVIDKFLELNPNPEIGDGTIISFSNAQCYQYNLGIRASLFPGQKDIQPGDLIMINSNNYHTYATELFNGDTAKVVGVSNVIEYQSAPVWSKIKGERKQKTIDLEFRKITIRVPSYDKDIECYIIESLLNSINRDLSIEMMQALYINFVMRFNEDQKKRKESGFNTYKVGSIEFKNELKKDPFYNALKVKYGYAITCHKAQGGEWDKVFVDYQGRVSLKKDALRWCYTATTRGVSAVYAINAPNFTPLSKLSFSGIVNVGKIPNNALCLKEVNCSPFHTENHHKAKSLKYWDVKEELEKTSFEVLNVESKGSFLEKYTIVNKENVKYILQASHKGSGHFIDKFKVLNNDRSQEVIDLECIFNYNSANKIKIQYSPTNEKLDGLYTLMQSKCDELEITITNIVEEIEKYYVVYFLITDSICASIQFYFDKNHHFSKAIPKSFQCDNDSKLTMLIDKLSNHAS
jgi:molybdopterin-guanine dinucleotide biosynthesis protein